MEINNLNKNKKQLLLKHLLSFVSENKQNLFDKIIQFRTRHITVVLEDIFQPQNASAVLRTCDLFGVQDVHIIENKYQYEVNPDVALGSSKWLNLVKYNTEKNNTLMAYKALKENGYQIVATTPHHNDVLLDDFPIDNKTAFVLGTELNGLSEVAIENADAFVNIPMYGFTESFNISVSAAIIMHHITEKLRNSNIKWQLTEEEIIDTKLNWALRVVKRSDLLLKDFLKIS